MSDGGSRQWSDGGILDRILSALAAAGVDRDVLTVKALAPLDHFHARGFPASVELGDAMPIEAGHRLLDIGCGIGGPARYYAERFACHVTGIDITEDFIDAAKNLTELVGLEDSVELHLGDGSRLPFPDSSFDGAYAQHVTMNIEDRSSFFSEVARVLKPGTFFAITEHGLGEAGAPHYPVPWSSDGSGSFLITPDETYRLLQEAGFQHIIAEDTGTKYLAGYKKAIELAEAGKLPPLGIHVLMGRSAPEKTVNAARNIEEGRTHPIQILCTKA